MSIISPTDYSKTSEHHLSGEHFQFHASQATAGKSDIKSTEVSGVSLIQSCVWIQFKQNVSPCSSCKNPRNAWDIFGMVAYFFYRLSHPCFSRLADPASHIFSWSRRSSWPMCWRKAEHCLERVRGQWKDFPCGTCQFFWKVIEACRLVLFLCSTWWRIRELARHWSLKGLTNHLLLVSSWSAPQCWFCCILLTKSGHWALCLAYKKGSFLFRT